MNNNVLRAGHQLKNGEYRIIDTLGQGGFGITYLAEQTGLQRRVAVKEFFMKESCNRDGQTSRVSVPSTGSRELVEKFKQKFLREARMIAALDNPHIVRIHDVFEENGTAYYVMEHLGGGSLSGKVKHSGPMPQAKAIGYIRQVADALDYLHGQNILHFDVKPSNILLGQSGQAVLIDFGISKHYDQAGSQTSSTPVGLSKGYAPLEQYQQGEISTFTPATDIYSLGATLYFLLVGQAPPEASMVNEDGLPPLPDSIDAPVREAVIKAMAPRRKERPQSVKEFLALLDAAPAPAPVAEEKEKEDKVDEEGEETMSPDEVRTRKPQPKPTPKPTPQPKPEPKPEKPKKPGKAAKHLDNRMLWAIVSVAVIIAIFFGAGLLRNSDHVTPLSNGWSKTKEGGRTTYTNGEVSFTMVAVAGGTFAMGADASDREAWENEKPAHDVTLSSFSIGETEVTQALWQAVMGSNPSEFKGDLQHPVERVSYNDCKTFIGKLNSLTGENFRLPTEAEWEFAARGGKRSKGYTYSGSDTIGSVAWYGDNSSWTTHPVKTKSPNELGLYDMTGNVWEWCNDWKGDYSGDSQTNPCGPQSGSYRVFRGGGWGLTARYCRVTYRGLNPPDYRDYFYGLRLVI